jgi:hypothetical protein
LDKTDRVTIIAAISYAILLCYLIITAALTHGHGVYIGALLAGIRLIIAVLLVLGRGGTPAYQGAGP